MRRLTACLVVGGMLAVSGLETLHRHAAQDPRGCCACGLERQACAAPATSVAPAASATVWTELPAPQLLAPARRMVAAAGARAPPAFA